MMVEMTVGRVGRTYVPVFAIDRPSHRTSWNELRYILWTIVHWYTLSFMYTFAGRGLYDTFHSDLIINTLYSNLVSHTLCSNLVFHTHHSIFVFHTLPPNLVSFRLSSNLVLDRVKVPYIVLSSKYKRFKSDYR